jgi:hypothetical protein
VTSRRRTAQAETIDSYAQTLPSIGEKWSPATGKIVGLEKDPQTKFASCTGLHLGLEESLRKPCACIGEAWTILSKACQSGSMMPL